MDADENVVLVGGNHEGAREVGEVIGGVFPGGLDEDIYLLSFLKRVIMANNGSKGVCVGGIQELVRFFKGPPQHRGLVALDEIEIFLWIFIYSYFFDLDIVSIIIIIVIIIIIIIIIILLLLLAVFAAAGSGCGGASVVYCLFFGSIGRGFLSLFLGEGLSAGSLFWRG